MAGKPRTMLKRVSELVAYADAFGAQLYAITPSQYLERHDSSDPLAAAWLDALERAAHSLHAVSALKTLLAEKVARAEAAAATADFDLVRR
ncbi:MAG TPA: hypothetical protein VGK58_13665 [Lacipirellulaceae bacterium]